MTTPIASFDGRHAYLSNFFETPVTIDGITYPTNENAFQALKCPERAREFVDLTPGQAKRLGRRVALRPDWDDVRLDVMYALNKQKFSENPALRERLLETGDRELIEGNTWRDTFWGVCNGAGENHLGRILMRIRQEIRDEVARA